MDFSMSNASCSTPFTLKFRSTAQQAGHGQCASYRPQQQFFACGHPKYYNPENDINDCHTWEIFDGADDLPFKVFVEGQCQEEFCMLLAPLMAHEPEKIDLAMDHSSAFPAPELGLSSPPRKRSDVTMVQDATVVPIPRAGPNFLRMQQRYAAHVRALAALGTRLAQVEPEVIETVEHFNHPVICRMFMLFKNAIDGEPHIDFDELNKDFDIQAQLDRLLEMQQTPWSQSKATIVRAVCEKLNMLEAELRALTVFVTEIQTLQEVFIEYNLLNINSCLDGHRAHIAGMHFHQYMEPVEHRGSGPWSRFFVNYDMDAPRGRLDHHPSHVDPQVIADLNEWNFYQAYNERWRNHSFSSLFESSTASSMRSPGHAKPLFTANFTASPMTFGTPSCFSPRHARPLFATNLTASPMTYDTPLCSNTPIWLKTPCRKRVSSCAGSSAGFMPTKRAKR